MTVLRIEFKHNGVLSLTNEKDIKTFFNQIHENNKFVFVGDYMINTDEVVYTSIAVKENDDEKNGYDRYEKGERMSGIVKVIGRIIATLIDRNIITIDDALYILEPITDTRGDKE